MKLSEWQESYRLLAKKAWADHPLWQNTPATPKQIDAIRLLMEQGLMETRIREYRLDVVRQLLGRPNLKSTKDLMMFEAHAAIELLKDEILSSPTRLVLSQGGGEWLGEAEKAVTLKSREVGQ